MGLLSLNLPVIGQSSATEDQKTRDALAAIQTVVNGNLDAANISTTFSNGNAEPAFSTFKVLHRPNGSLVAGNVNGVYGLGDNLQAVGLTLTPATSVIYIDPSFFTAGARTTRYRLRLMLATNNVAPTGNYTAGLYQVTSVGAASGVPVVSGVSAVVAGSTATVTAPIANSLNIADSGDFAAPVAGGYIVGLATTATVAAGSGVALRAELLMRQT